MPPEGHVETRLPDPELHDVISRQIMPLYDYFCPTNRRMVEVRHSMNAQIRTWGELVEAAGVDAGDTPADTEVQRLISGGSVHTSTSSKPQAPCGPGCGCHHGAA